MYYSCLHIVAFFFYLKYCIEAPLSGQSKHIFHKQHRLLNVSYVPFFLKEFVKRAYYKSFSRLDISVTLLDVHCCKILYFFNDVHHILYKRLDITMHSYLSNFVCWLNNRDLYLSEVCKEFVNMKHQ